MWIELIRYSSTTRTMTRTGDTIMRPSPLRISGVSGSTSSVRPSSAVTRTAASGGHGRRADRAPDFPVHGDLARLSGRQVGQRPPRRADQPVGAGHRLMLLRLHRQPAQEQHDGGDRERDRHHELVADTDAGQLVGDHHRSNHQRRCAADAQHAEARHLDLHDQQRDAEDDQQHAARVHGQDLEGEEREQQRDAAGDAGQRSRPGSTAPPSARACPA